MTKNVKMMYKGSADEFKSRYNELKKRNDKTSDEISEMKRLETIITALERIIVRNKIDDLFD